MTPSMTRRSLFLTTHGTAALMAAAKSSVRVLRLPLRTRVEAFKGSGVWEEVHFETLLSKTAFGSPRFGQGNQAGGLTMAV